MRNMPIYVLDASVILKAFLQEEDRIKVLQIINLKDNYKISIFLPEFFRYEFFNTMNRKIGREGAKKIFRTFTSIQVSLIVLEDDLTESALKINSKYPQTSFYDAAYHAIAKAYNATLITADEKYYNQTRREGHIKLLKNFKI